MDFRSRVTSSGDRSLPSFSCTDRDSARDPVWFAARALISFDRRGLAKSAAGLMVLLVVSLLLGAYAPASSAESVLETVRGRGYVKCAIGNRMVGDTRIGKTGYEGFFPEFCRILALALFGDREAVNMSPVIIRHGLQSISEGEVDVFISNVTWTFSRDLKLKLTPAAVLYYDGQGFISHKDTVSGSLAKLGKATVCVSRSTTTIANLKDFTKLHNLTWTVHAYESSQGRNDAFFSRKCNLMTADRLVLATLRATATDDPGKYVLHEEVISKEPLVAYVHTKDMQWANVVRWAIYATILAEEKGITRDNYKTHLASRDPVARRLLGVEATAGTKAAGLPADWARRIIAGSGNYGEIFERYLGAKSQIKITRGANKLWKNGGLMYSPPFR